jgi:hypothetical protein
VTCGSVIVAWGRSGPVSLAPYCCASLTPVQTVGTAGNYEGSPGLGCRSGITLPRSAISMAQA